MEFKLEAVLDKTPAQREEELNQAGNVAIAKVEAIRELLAAAYPMNHATRLNKIEDIALGGNHV